MKVPVLCSALVAATALMSPALADSPQHFLRQAIEGDNSEMMLGRIAQRQADSQSVRDYGRTLVSDHSTARSEAVGVATRMGVRGAASDRDIAPEARDEQHRLADLQGRDFDREFIRYMVDDHRKDIGDFQGEARENHGPASQMAERQLPTLRKHLELAQSIAARQTGDTNMGDRDRGRNRQMDRDQNNRNDDNNRDR